MLRTRHVAAIVITALGLLPEVESFQLLPKGTLHHRDSGNMNAAVTATTATAARPAWDAEGGSCVDNQVAGFEGQIPSPLYVFG